MYGLLRVTVLLLAMSLAGVAQAQSNEELRAAAFEEIHQKLTDPDPTLRLAAMEAILGSGDMLRIAIATSIAMQSDDVLLRSLAMRGFFITQKQVDLQIVYPPEMEKQYQAVLFDPKKLDTLFNRVFFQIGGYGPVSIHNSGRVASIVFELNDDHMGGRAYFLVNGRRDDASSSDIRINGDVVLFEIVNTHFGNRDIGNCRFKLNPPEKNLIVGSMGCGPLDYPISAEVR
jgi:hypothetical protein